MEFSPQGISRQTEDIFEKYLQGAVGDEEFEALCAAHPNRAGELRRLRAMRELIATLPRGPVMDALRRQRDSGRDGDAAVGAVEVDHMTSEVMRRLGERTGSFERYRIDGEICSGGQGVVVSAWDEDLRRRLAMKIMLKDGLLPQKDQSGQSSQRALGRFLEEAQVTGQLDHPGIVPVHELGIDSSGSAYFTMKYVRGETLGAVFESVREGRDGWTQTRVLHALLKVCEAVSYAHSKGVIHRDLKPSNIMIGRFGEVFVMDWGLARVEGQGEGRDIRIRVEEGDRTVPLTAIVRTDRLENFDSNLTLDGEVLGTPAYMPPEQALGQTDSMGPASDTYALGAMLYHLLAGRAPFVPRGGARIPKYVLLYEVQTGSPRPVAESNPDVAPELAAICEKAMQREISRRYTNVRELSADLEAYLEGRVVSAYASGALAELGKWIDRNRTLARMSAALIVALVAGLVGTIFWQAKSHRNEVLAQEKQEEIFQLSASVYIEGLLEHQETLWPVHPDLIGRYSEWLDRTSELLSELPRHRAQRELLGARAVAPDGGRKLAQLKTHPDYGTLKTLWGKIKSKKRALRQRLGERDVTIPEVDWEAIPIDVQLLDRFAEARIHPERRIFGEEPLGLAYSIRAAELAPEDPFLLRNLAFAYQVVGLDEDAVNTGHAALQNAPKENRSDFDKWLKRIEAEWESKDAEGLAADQLEIEELELRRDELEESMVGLVFSSEDKESEWWNEQLDTLISGMEAIEDSGLLAESGLSREFGWSVPLRRSFAERLRSGYAKGGEYWLAWERVLPDMRADYPGIEAQIGLIPIGRDPRSGLWEFADLHAGIPPKRGTDGKLNLTVESSAVFVLLPGGLFYMGCQRKDRNAPNYDPGSEKTEWPARRVWLSPFFLSKYELTQSQWRRLTGERPSRFIPGGRFSVSELHPVESISWGDCETVCRRFGWSLPSEAQWEYAARGGSKTVFPTGDDEDSVLRSGAVNLADRSLNQAAWAPILADALRRTNFWSELQDHSPVHAPVNHYTPNPYGLYHMVGNVAEWCLDAYEAQFYRILPAVDPVNRVEGTRERCVRGGSFLDGPEVARCGHRANRLGGNVDYTVGFRPVRELSHYTSPFAR